MIAADMSPGEGICSHEGENSSPDSVFRTPITSSAGAYPEEMSIAIIGMACRFPGDATSPEKLWDLCADGSSAWSPIPSARFHPEAWYHPDKGHVGTFHVQGAHFLAEDITLFDAPFFNFSSDFASEMDPEIRLQLETVYEALENAGIPMEQVAGTRTSVFAGTSFRDNHDNHARDPITLDTAFVTGNGAAMIANRVSHFYDCRGPSVMVDTGCSTSLTLLHLACQNLRAGESTMSIVGGSNVLLNPDIFIAGAKFGLFSAEGKCFAFDSRASGYGRGDGIASIIIKPLASAVRDGNPIRAIIRNTAANQDGKTMTITSPSREAQQDLMRECYEKAGLDPIQTAYVEAHGTGTQAGDVTEAHAIGTVFGEPRKRAGPIVMGSVKANIGHTEATSGLAGVIKVVMALERGYIPPQANFENGNPNIPLPELNIKIPLSMEPWPSQGLRRASLNSFGYGGANAHAIIEHPNYLTLEHSESYKNGLIMNPKTRSRVLMWSAKDKIAVTAMCHLLGQYLENHTAAGENEQLLDRLAVTLGEHRSRLCWSVACSASTVDELLTKLGDTQQMRPCRTSSVPRLGFVFTGQGAQWYAMGRELIALYPAFRESLHEAQQCLTELGASWSLTEELTRPESDSRINEATFSLPLSVAIQLALVDLLRSWEVHPTGVTGHSSGEIGAAYAAGMIDLKFAMAVAYTRGLLTTHVRGILDCDGGMLAVALSRKQAQAKISCVRSGELVVACVNSPVSVTLSGDLPAIQEIEALLVAEKVFTRRLKVNIAYHSHHMLPLAEPYHMELSRWVQTEPQSDRGVRYSSPTTGGIITSAAHIASPDHWVRNMVQPVEFLDSLRNLCLGSNLDGNPPTYMVDMLIELGPHGALKGPIQQTLALPELKEAGISYATCLKRGESADQSMHKLVCALTQRGYPVNLRPVNFPYGHHDLPILTDLPPYPWNHQARYWKEPRLNKALRDVSVAPHDLLGRPSVDFSPLTPSWRHIIRPSDVPWVRDHLVQSTIVYPGAGYICMVIEAVRQIAQHPSEISSYELKKIQFASALILDDVADGVDVRLSMRSCSDSTLDGPGWMDFYIQSIDRNGKWTCHCEGQITATRKEHTRESPLWDVRPTQSVAGLSTNHWENTDISWRQVDSIDTYNTFSRIGLAYGKMFKNVVSSRIAPGRSSSIIRIPDTATSMPHQHQHSHVMHPTTLDGIFQATYHNLTAAESTQWTTMVPKSIKSLSVATGISNLAGDLLQMKSRLVDSRSKGFESSATVFDATTSDREKPPVLMIEGLLCQSISSVAPTNSERKKPCFTTVWKPDLDMMQPSDVLYRGTTGLSQGAKMVQDLRLEAQAFMVDATRQLAGAKITDVRQRRYIEWMRNTPIHVYDYIKLGSPGESMMKGIGDQPAEGGLVRQIGQNLPGILSGHINPLVVAVQSSEDGKESASFVWCYHQIRTIVELFSHKRPHAVIMEVGAGMGECAKVVLKGLSTEETMDTTLPFARYDLTDPDSEMVECSRARLGNQGLVRFRTYNIDSNPGAQGFDVNSYDLIIASALVLYRAHNIGHAMRSIRTLLKPGGRVLIWGPALDRLDVRMVYGALPGWQNASADYGLDPTPSVRQWHTVLQLSGFDNGAMELYDCDDKESQMTNVTVAITKSEARPPAFMKVALVYLVEPPPDEWVNALVKNLSTLEVPCEVHIQCLTEAQDWSKSFVVFLSELEEPVLDRPTLERFEGLRSLLTRSQGVLWVSLGGQLDSPNPFTSLHQGLFRTLRCENPSIRYISLDLDPGVPALDSTTSHQVARVLYAVFNSPHDQAQPLPEIEYAVRSGLIQVPRIFKKPLENKEMGRGVGLTPIMRPFLNVGWNVRLGTTAPGLLENLAFTVDSGLDTPLLDEFVEIIPKAFGLNFRDVMVALDQIHETRLGFECSGVVSRVGRKAASEGFTVGDRVYAFALGCFATTVRVPFQCIFHIPEWMGFETGASMGLVHATAYHGLSELAHLRSDETVLIHSGSGGVGQAAIMLAQNIGAEIFVSVGSKEKRDFLIDVYGIAPDHVFYSHDASFSNQIMAKTNGKGIDVILNSLSGPLLRETWQCIAAFGRFIEIGKRDIEQNKCLELAPFARCVSFSSLDLITLAEQRPTEIARIFSAISALICEKKIGPVTPIQVFPMSELERAFRVMQLGKHMGKIILRPMEDDWVKVLPVARSINLSPDASYLIVGGLGGIGRSVSKRLVERGARHLVLLSRHAASPSPEVETFVRVLRSAGANVVLKACDVTDLSQLSRVVTECSGTMPPLKGVVQSAMIILDSIFEHMPWIDYTTVVKTKVQGTWNLHEVLKNTDLDFFVMLSSICGVGGNAGQANYAAGGAFQDALARHRAALGFPAVSIDLGAVESIGLLAENKDLADHLSKLGLPALDEDEVLRLVEAAISNPKRPVHSSQIITGLPFNFDRSDSPAFWNQDVRFTPLERVSGLSSTPELINSTAGITVANTKARISAAMAFGDAARLVQEAFTQKLAHTFGRPQSEIDLAATPIAIGVDSLIAAELRNWIVATLEVECSIFEVMQSPSIGELAKNMASKSRLIRLAVQRTNGGSAAD